MTSNKAQSFSDGMQVPRDPLDRLRSYRQHPDRARGLGEDLAVVLHSTKKISVSEQAAGEAWGALVPDMIGECTRIGGFRAGKLIVLVPSSAHRYTVDRWLGSGGLRALQELARVPIGGVILKITREFDRI